MLLLCVIIFECNYSSANLPKMSNVILGFFFWGLFWGSKGEVGWGAGVLRHGSKGRGRLKGFFIYLVFSILSLVNTEICDFILS